MTCTSAELGSCQLPLVAHRRVCVDDVWCQRPIGREPEGPSWRRLNQYFVHLTCPSYTSRAYCGPLQGNPELVCETTRGAGMLFHWTLPIPALAPGRYHPGGKTGITVCHLAIISGGALESAGGDDVRGGVRESLNRVTRNFDGVYRAQRDFATALDQAG
jgi:hypothetical protein